MEKNVFYYQRYLLRCLLILPIVIAALLVEYLVGARMELKLVYRLVILAAALVLSYLWYRFCGSLPFLKRQGTYGTQGGDLWIEKRPGNRTLLSDVYEVYIMEKNMLGVRIALLHVGYGKSQFELYSLPMASGEGYKDTGIYTVFEKLLARNPKLKANQDYFGSTTGKWYKR